MSTNFNKIISIFIGANIFCAFISLIYFMIDYFHPYISYMDGQLNVINNIILIMIISMIMVFVNHFSKYATSNIISSKTKRGIGFYDEGVATLEYIVHFIYRFCLLCATILNLSLWANIINHIF